MWKSEAMDAVSKATGMRTSASFIAGACARTEAALQ